MKRKDFIKRAASFGFVLVAGTAFAPILNHQRLMKKNIAYTTRGHRADIGNIGIYRLVSNSYEDHIGHFVFLDYFPPFAIKEKTLHPDFAHPHRGIATLTYLLNGEVDHYDSRKHRGTVHSGGVQWMKAGNGVIHNEAMGPDSKTAGQISHGFQFWVNLPAKNKQESPDYLAVQAEELPLLPLPNDAGTLKVVVGEYEGQTSKIPTYAQQYLYHIRLKVGKKLVLPTKAGLDYAIFLPQDDLYINDNLYYSGDLIGFDKEAGNIEMANLSDTEAEFILFGGEKYAEPFVARGPFVMSTDAEIRQAYADFRSGKYGDMAYD